MAKKRVNFAVKTTGTITGLYLWVENKNVVLRNKKGHIYLVPRSSNYELIYLAKGRKNATIEIVTTASGKELSKQKDKIVTKARVYGLDQFRLGADS